MLRIIPIDGTFNWIFFNLAIFVFTLFVQSKYSYLYFSRQFEHDPNKAACHIKGHGFSSKKEGLLNPKALKYH